MCLYLWCMVCCSFSWCRPNKYLVSLSLVLILIKLIDFVPVFISCSEYLIESGMLILPVTIFT